MKYYKYNLERGLVDILRWYKKTKDDGVIQKLRNKNVGISSCEGKTKAKIKRIVEKGKWIEVTKDSWG